MFSFVFQCVFSLIQIAQKRISRITSVQLIHGKSHFTPQSCGRQHSRARRQYGRTHQSQDTPEAPWGALILSTSFIANFSPMTRRSPPGSAATVSSSIPVTCLRCFMRSWRSSAVSPSTNSRRSVNGALQHRDTPRKTSNAEWKIPVGPLGQGHTYAVGAAIAAKALYARTGNPASNTKRFTPTSLTEVSKRKSLKAQVVWPDTSDWTTSSCFSTPTKFNSRPKRPM